MIAAASGPLGPRTIPVFTEQELSNWNAGRWLNDLLYR
ncbi:hypothetical protein ECH7EC4113_2004 [Escherichia coli O157:H7 str. EC4113]|nr:hypothetical protein ECH7EC4113_2004 [Escherichia coli O157:H7 str. EC4113]